MSDITLERSEDLESTSTCFTKGMTGEQIKAAAYKAQADAILLIRGKSKSKTKIKFQDGSSLKHLNQLREEQKMGVIL